MSAAGSFPLSLFRSLLLIFLTCLLTVGSALAQDYPARAVTLVVPYPPGSATDIVARLLQPKLSQALKQNVIVENRGGASTNIGTEFVSRAAPDGYTVLIQAPNIVTNEFAFSSLRWKREDFAPVAQLVRWSNVLLAGPSATARDMKQLLASTKATSAGYNYGSPGPGSLSHLAVEMVKNRSDIGMQHVTFTGPAPMITSLLGGHIQYGATNPANFMAHVREGKHKLTPIVVLGSQRDTTIPDVPALSEFGITGIESYGWLGALVPARTPPAIINRLNNELIKALNSPEIQEKLKANYLEPAGSTPEEFARFMLSENRKWGEATKAAGIKPE
jgi:tripartite-type tricarboxylate transporter receptor subunit TctC